MAKEPSKSLSTDEDLRLLQETILKAILMGDRLPGSNQQTNMPDISFILNQPNVVLESDNLAGTISVEESPKQLLLLTREAILEEASDKGDLTYLQFQPPKIEAEKVRLTLQAKIAPQDPDKKPLGLSGVQVEFQKVGNQWEITEEPAYFAV